MADTPILNYKGKYDGPEIDRAVELALGLENIESCPYHIYVSLSQPDYVLTVGLGDAEGNLFNHAEIDLPLESMVVNATYENGNIILHLQDGTSTEPIPISALIAGLVSETRTIAGIDLRDDITTKELRDALDVYTKDSVDQLVSNLENTIDETLNEMNQSLDDLSDLTSEHDTQIKKNTSDIAINKSDILTVKNDIAINRATLGEQRINIFDGELKIGEINSSTGAESNNQIAAISKNYILISRNATISISRSKTGSFMSWRFYDEYKNFIGIADNTNVQLIHGSNISNMIADGDTFACFKIINPNIRYIRFRDATKSLTNIYTFVEGEYTPATMPAHEEYKPSLQEQINNLYVRNRGNITTTIMDNAKDGILGGYITGYGMETWGTLTTRTLYAGNTESEKRKMQIVELSNGERGTRLYSNSSWGAFTFNETATAQTQNE